jgi:hypothetical protein
MSTGENVQARYRLLVPKVLGRALELLSDRKRWTTGMLARTKDNYNTNPTSPYAEKWCAVGAIEKCAHEVIEAEEGSDRHLSYGVLFQMAQQEVRPHIVAAGKGPVVEANGRYQVEIPQINDHPQNGGYLAVVRGLASAVGASLTLSAQQQRTIDRFEARSEAARKGWATRARNQSAMWEAIRADRMAMRAQQAQQTLPEQPTMTFGGTLAQPPTTDSTDADTQRKDSPLCATSRV